MRTPQQQQSITTITVIVNLPITAIVPLAHFDINQNLNQNLNENQDENLKGQNVHEVAGAGLEAVGIKGLLQGGVEEWRIYARRVAREVMVSLRTLSSVRCAGSSDRDGSTSTTSSLSSYVLERERNTEETAMAVGDFQLLESPIQLGQTQGNSFLIRLKNLPLTVEDTLETVECSDSSDFDRDRDRDRDRDSDRDRSDRSRVEVISVEQRIRDKLALAAQVRV